MNKNHFNEFNDDYDHKDSKCEYIVENVLFEPLLETDKLEYQNLVESFNSVLQNSCHCLGSCGSYDTCTHGGNYIESLNELILNPHRHCKDLIYECSVSCRCDPSSCRNRLVQYGPRLNLEIIPSKLLHKQYSLRTNAPIPRGGFICEYAGEILTRKEAERRMMDKSGCYGIPSAKENKMNYLLCLNEYSLDSGEGTTSSSLPQQTFIDPCLKGNIGRYLNHSCKPNCEILSVRVDCPIPKIAIFAKEYIDAGEELCFHYGGGVNVNKKGTNIFQGNELTLCLCGSDNCDKFLPNLAF